MCNNATFTITACICCTVIAIPHHVTNAFFVLDKRPEGSGKLSLVCAWPAYFTYVEEYRHSV